VNKTEVAKLVTLVSGLDRQPTDQAMVEMWHRVLGDYTFTECEAALVPAYKESKGFISARLVDAMVRKARTENALKTESVQRQEIEAQTDVAPPPQCRQHSKSINTCVSCATMIYEKSLAIGEGWNLHKWATENVYEEIF
jgi:hypothetical protein